MELERLRKRRERLSPTPDYVWVYRAEGDQLFYVSTAETSGTKPPVVGIWMPTPEALNALNRGLRIPGVLGAKPSSAWRAEQEERDKRYWSPGPMSDERFYRAYDKVASRLSEEHGVRLRPDRALPAGISPAQLIDELKRAIPEARLLDEIDDTDH